MHSVRVQNKRLCGRVVDLPTQILASLIAPLMFAGFHNHSPLLTMLNIVPYNCFKHHLSGLGFPQSRNAPLYNPFPRAGHRVTEIGSGGPFFESLMRKHFGSVEPLLVHLYQKIEKWNLCSY